MLLESFSDPSRVFQYDYIYVDATLLLIWIFFLLWNKKHKALLFGLVIAPIIYFIDAQIWWNTLTEGGVFIREYWIGGVQITHPLGEYFLLKFGADFMMTISYALFTFSWIWIMFENVRKTNWREVIKYTSLFFVLWILTPALSILISLNDTLVQAVRHMDSQMLFWIINVLIGYSLLLIVYRHNLKLVVKVFLIGLVGALIMEIPLYLFDIRPTSIYFVLFEAVFLLNQGVPYLFLFWDKVCQNSSILKINNQD